MGKSTDYPDAPNYAELIPLQEQSNLNQFNTMLDAMRANQISPLGTQTWTKTPTFDATGYDRATSDWLAAGYSPELNNLRYGNVTPYNAGEAYPYPSITTPSRAATYDSGNTWGPGSSDMGLDRYAPSGATSSGTSSGFYGTMPRPTPDDFTKYNWTYEQKLSPEMQAIFDANVKSQLGMTGLLDALTQRVSSVQGQPLDTSGLPEMVDSSGFPQGGLQTGEDLYQGSTLGADSLSRGRLYSAEDIVGGGLKAPEYDPWAVDVSQQLNAISPTGFSKEAADAYYNQLSRYLKPEQENQTRYLEGRLGEQGFVVGTPAWKEELDRLTKTQDMALGDIKDRAVLGGFNVGNTQAQLALALANALSGNALNVQNLRRQQGLDANQVAQQLFANSLSRGQFGNTAQQQAYAQSLGAAGLENALQQQLFGQSLQGAGLTNQAQQQAFNQALQGGTFQNQARQQALAEILAQRALPFNELSAIRSGQQVQVPSNQAQYSVPNLQGVDLLGTAQQDYMNQIAGANAQTGSQNALLSSLLGLGGTAMLSPWLGPMLSGLAGGTGAGLISGGSGLRF